MAALAAAIVLAGCGAARQDANEQSRVYRVAVPLASFPAKQRIATRNLMYIAVRNDDVRAIPNVAVTIDSFNLLLSRPDLASQRRPVWIVDAGPYGGETSYVSTWALGRLAPGQTAVFKWLVTPVTSGSYQVSYHVAAGLGGKAVARLANGGAPKGTFSVYIPQAPAVANVVPRSGRVVTTPQSVPQPVPQVKPNTTTIPVGPNEPTTPTTSTTPGY